MLKVFIWVNTTLNTWAKVENLKKNNRNYNLGAAETRVESRPGKTGKYM